MISKNPKPCVGLVGEKMQPSSILYYFDEPLIFTANIGGVDSIVIKVDEDDDGVVSSYIAAPTNDTIINMLLSGKVSTRSVLMQPFCLVVDAVEMEVKTAFMTSPVDIYDEFLPEPHNGLYPEHGHVFDRHIFEIEAEPFLGLYFSGGELGRSIPLSNLKSIVDETYSMLTRMFRAAFSSYVTGGVISERAAATALLIPVREPKFASLSLEIDEPMINLSRIRGGEKVDYDAVKSNIQSSNEALLSSVGDLIGSLHGGRSFDFDKNFSVIDLLQVVIPDENSPYDNVEFSGSGIQKPLLIGRSEGARVKDIYRAKVANRSEAEGVVVEINTPSQTFLLKDKMGRITTCHARSGLWEKIKHELLKILHKDQEVRVYGAITKRKKRDYGHIHRVVISGGVEYSE